MTSPAIIAQNLEKRFGVANVAIIKKISLEIKTGEFVAITGRSGSGKSTLLYLLSGLDDPTSGNVIINGKNLSQLDSQEIHRFRNLEMGFVFQFHYLLPELNSLENVLMPARKLHHELDKREYALELLDRFEVRHCAEKKPSQMSGGEMQRVAIARSMIMQPAFLFADEPTGNLDSVNGETVMSIFEQINREQKTTILMVTHEADYARRASRQIFLTDGKIEHDKSQRHIHRR
ncbi:MAG: ABC transporter ATP-binding protein [Leptospiraceae bacterium]|nr:ABC transporter ATP-binding protein [Leptospiraceae bacterium]